MARHESEQYGESYYAMVWFGAKGYPEPVSSGRCYMTGMLGMLRHFGETDLLFADGTSGDGFSFRWCPVWGAPAFNGGKGAFHELWEYTPQALGFRSYWEEDREGGREEAWATLRSLIDCDIPVQVATHYSLIRPYGDHTSPALALRGQRPGANYASGHYIVSAGYDEQAGAVTIYELTDIRTPDGETRKLFAQGQIPNHGVLGRASAAGYLRRVALELAKRNLDAEAVKAASELMQ